MIIAEHSNGNGNGTSRRSRRRGRSGKRGTAQIQLTSHPTSRNAYTETRQWLLEQHGPICAYCGGRFDHRAMTLDHVTPRRGQTAYDRRDNLVLACTTCNAAKRDLSAAAYLLAVRSRAVNLLRYGSHLSPMLLDLARQLAPEVAAEIAAESANGGASAATPRERVRWADLDDDGDSPYKD